MMRKSRGARPAIEGEGEAGRLLQGEVGGGEDVGVARREQEVDFGGPGADALDAAKGGNGVIGASAFERGEVELAGKRRLLDCPQGADLRRGKSGGAEQVIAGRGELFRRDALQGSFEPVVNGPARPQSKSAGR